MKYKILIIGSGMAAQSATGFFSKNPNFSHGIAETADDALKKLSCSKYHLVVIYQDILEFGDGLLISRIHKKCPSMPIIAYNGPASRFFYSDEFRLDSPELDQKYFDLILKILNIHDESFTIIGSVRYYPEDACLETDHSKIFLSRTENALLNKLITNKNKIVTPKELKSSVWKDEPGNGELAVYISKLRKKLDLASDNTLSLTNVRHRGYILME
ncbi:MAG: winged helix-turn-helix domain-containing protein [Eubacteriales bacterium]|nr:winged helix-turn-helix domain-containing protein [Eubacteriales bacterium]